MNFDMSVVIPPHHIGRLGHLTMRSVFRGVGYASEKGIRTEIIIVMDKPDKKTREYFSRYEKSECIIETVDLGDLGLTRNFGVSLSSGKYVTFLDDDNLFGMNWLYESFRYLERTNDEIIVHPEYHVSFGTESLIWRQIGSNNSNFRVGNLIEYNYWDAVCATKREILSNFPYESTTRSEGFGFEDWHFNCETLAAGIEHDIVPCTVHFMRRKKTGSLLGLSHEANRIVRPTKLFEPAILSYLLKKKKYIK